MDPPTVNANPTVLDVSKERHHKRHALEWPELAAISADPVLSHHEAEDFGSTRSNRPKQRRQRSPDDWAVLNALVDSSIASNGKGIALLRNLGLHYPMDESQRQVSVKQTNGFSWSFPSTAASSLAFRTDKEEKDDNKKMETPTTDPETRMDRDVIDAEEIFDIIRNIQDPEHPLTLEQLGVVSAEQIVVQDRTQDKHDDDKAGCPYSSVDVRFTPTIPHCSMATQIGLCLMVKLNRSLPGFKTTVRIEPGTHASENAINKQLADKERVCAALENKHLASIVNKCILNGMTGE